MPEIMKPEDILSGLSEAMAKAKKEASSEGLKAIEKRLTAISSALGDVVQALEKGDDTDEAEKYAALVEAIKGLRIESPAFSPTINPSEVVVQAATPVNNVTVQPAKVEVQHIVIPAPQVTHVEREESKTVKVEFEYVGDRVLGATITRG